ALFYFSRGFAPEAIGVLSQMLKKEPEIITRSSFRLLRGATNFALRRYEEAEKDLNHASLDGNDEGEFWRAVVKAGVGDLQSTAPTLKRTGGIYRAYPHALKIPLGMLVASSAIATGDIKYGANTLQALSEEKPTDIELDQLAFIEGTLRDLTGDTDKAVAAWEAVAKGKHRPSIAKAIVARAELLLKKGQIEPAEAIEELEKLRFSWRGGEFEFELLRKLGRLYFSIADYRNGLRIMRQAASYFRDNKKVPEITEEMAKAFRELYLNDAADAMPPVRAIALFEEFKELTPSGADGDEMFRKLADRLAKVDLLDQAAKLLVQQVDFRLKGEQRARVGARLATIHLINRDPEAAEAVLKKTELAGLPADLARQRGLLKARALVDGGRHPEALIFLEDDESEEAFLLRSEIYWQARDWPRVAKVMQQLLRFAKAAPKKPLNEEQAALVLNLSVAFALSTNDRSLDRVRKDYGPAMAQTPLRDAFTLI
ncbi:MAG: tetratricopeptide repeat protein, partial [Rhodospirillales bacterium]|nr:tetratricopeptide repeat protein [Rhodospirillales bacterium]